MLNVEIFFFFFFGEKYMKCQERHLSIDNNCIHTQCVKKCQIYSFNKIEFFSGPYFRSVELNAKRYFINPRIQPEYGKIRTLHAATGLGN